MKRTDETLRSMISEQLRELQKTMRDDVAQTIMHKICQKALIEANQQDVQVDRLQEGVTKSAALWAMHDEMRPFSTHVRSRFKIVPAERFTEPLLIDIKEMIDEEMQEWPGDQKE